ncbi:MAG TPA: GspH/FimT family pseudopilin [Candidatus Competibacteraceae bacterium]|nr:GspH/FimT family pseudopilin [Candidatus Competibacteraceae bacterium]
MGRCRGFTLLELMIALALGAVVLTLGIPSLQELVRNQHMVTASNELLTTLALARFEAIKRSVRVTLCKSLDGQQCTPDSHWEEGGLVFVDGSETAKVDGDDRPIRVYPRLEGELTLRTGETFSAYVSFLPSGMSEGKTKLANDTFRLCDARGSGMARAIIVNRSGRIRVERGTNQCP